MKKFGKRLLSVLLVVLMVVGMIPSGTYSAADKTIYFKPNSEWLKAGAWTAAYVWNDSGNTWKEMTDSDEDGYYECTISTDYSKVTFVRMDPAKTALDWASKWNQTGDLTIDGNCYTVNDGATMDNITGSWSTYTPSGGGSGTGGSGGTTTEENVIYLDASGSNFDTAGATFAVTVSGGSGGDQTIAMTKVDSSSHYYKVTIPEGYTYIAFLRCDKSGNTGWGNLVNYGSWPKIPTDGKNCYVASGYDTNGTWTTYSGGSGSGETEDTLTLQWINATLYDYMSDPETKDGWLDFTNDNLDNKRPFGTFNKAIETLVNQQTSSVITNVYVKPNSNWKQGSAWFAAYFYNKSTNAETWVKCSLVEDGIYGCGVPDGNWEGFIFVRMNPAKQALSWDSKWDQTIDLGFQTNGSNLYTINDGYWNNAEGTWSKYGDTAETSNEEWVFPLYFGNFDDASDGTYTNFYHKANNSGGFGGNFHTSVQGLVKPELVNGQLMVTNNLAAPYFDSDWLADNHGVTKETQFPMRKTSKDGITYYEFDSEGGRDNVWSENYNADSLVLKYGAGDTYSVNDYMYMADKSANKPGFFPFSKYTDNGGQNHNFGFGAKFEVKFTVPKDGLKNGVPVTFDFTGDDDLWVFIDGKLVLDMGGAHKMAKGTIDFNAEEATVTTAVYDLTDQTDGNSGTKHDSGKTYDFSESFDNQNDTKVHTLTVFYMERGMIESNLKFGFSFEPLPTGLSVSKEVNVSGVNTGLQEVVKVQDSFDFNMQTSSSQTGPYTNVTDVTYTKDWDGAKIDTVEMTDGNILGLADNIYAKDFKNSSGTSAFTSGTCFKITETVNNKYTTVWKVYDLTDTTAPVATGSDTSAEFQFGEVLAADELKRVNYNVHFINTPATGTLTLTKKWKDGQTEPSGETYNFVIMIDLDGESGTAYSYAPYALGGDIGDTDAGGNIALGVGQTVTFTGIPAGASYMIRETVSADAAWKVDSSVNTTGTITAGGTCEAVFTNATKGALALVTDQIVMDYGKNIQVNVLANDADAFVSADYITAITQYVKNENEYTYTVIGTAEDAVWTVKVVGFVASKDADASAYKTTISTDNASYSVTTDKKVEVALKGFLSEVDTVYCVVEVINTKGTEETTDDTTRYCLNELNVIPATNMYYEDSFDGFTYVDPDEATSNSDSLWYTDTDSNGSDSLQDDGTVGTNVAYGYDSSYDDDTYYSNGTVKKVVVPKTTSIGGYGKTYMEFTFEGTGFDLMASTGADAATIKAQIYKASDLDNVYKSATVNNVGANDLNQIPVLSCEDLGYDEYYVKVHVYAAYSNADYPALERGGTFKFDGLRIYDPIDTTAETTDAAIALNAYKADKEAYVERLEIRDLIIGAGDFDPTTEGTEGDGIVYVEAGEEAPTTKNQYATITDYEVVGPNNETYLQTSPEGESSGIVFILNVSSIPESIQIGAKSINGAETSMDVYLVNPDDDSEAYLGATIGHATAQNYGSFVDVSNVEITDFTPYFAGTEGDYYAYVKIMHYDGAPVSVTDIKATFAAESTMGVMYNTQMANYFNISSETNNEATTEGLVLNSAAFTTSSIRYTKQATLVVVTSAEVTEIVVENESGKAMSAAVSSVVTEDGNIEWTLKFKPGAVGTRTFSVYGVDADGNVTNTESVSIEATRR